MTRFNDYAKGHRSYSAIIKVLACAALIVGATDPAWSRHGAGTVAASDSGSDVSVRYDQRTDVNQFIEEMVDRHGFVRSELQQVFEHARYNETVARLINPATSPQPADWRVYREKLLVPARIEAGTAFWQANRAVLERAARVYGVPEEIIVGILGIETMYGRNTGKFRVIDALTTLAFDYPNKDKDRSPLFREQLEDFLVMVRDQNLDVFAQRGSYAGAMGMPQFMPGSFLKYAVDFDQDGTIDLWTSTSDVIGSVANFLAQNGWQSGEPVYFPSELLPGQDDPATLRRLTDAGSEPQWTADELRAAGLHVPEIAHPDRLVSVINLPNGTDTAEYVLGTMNFHALTRYNRSYFYVMAVCELGAIVRDELNQQSALHHLNRETHP